MAYKNMKTIEPKIKRVIAKFLVSGESAATLHKRCKNIGKLISKNGKDYKEIEVGT